MSRKQPPSYLRSCSGEPMRLSIGHRAYIALWTAPKHHPRQRAHPAWIVAVILVWIAVVLFVLTRR